MMAKNIDGPHAGHRGRLKERFLKSGLEGFEEHNILELLLFYSVPYRDTNEIAHRLIDRFGSVEEVLDAPYEDLCKVDGVGEHSASLIKLIPSMSAYYLMQKHREKQTLSSAEDIANFLIGRYLFEKHEVFSIVCLDSECHFLGFEKISEGSSNITEVNLIKAVDTVIRKNATCIVIAHNHPSGNPSPSVADLSTTRRICDAFKLINIRVLDHIIIAGEDYFSMMSEKAYASLFIK